MANNQSFDPIGEARKRFPGLANQPDEKISQFLSQPQNFRSTFPEYQHLDDDTIQRNMMKYGPPAGSSPLAPIPPGLQGPSDTRSLWQKTKDWATSGLLSKDTILDMAGQPGFGRPWYANPAQATAHVIAPKSVPAPQTDPINLHGFAPAEKAAQIISDQTSPANLTLDAVLMGGGAAANGLRGAAEVAEGANAAKWLNRGAKAVRAIDRGTNAVLAGEGAYNTTVNGAKTVEDPSSASNWLNLGLSAAQTAGGAYGATKGFFSPRMAEPNSYVPALSRGEFAQRLTDPARGTPLNLDLAQATESPAMKDVKGFLNKMPGSRGVMAQNAEDNLAALQDRLKGDLNSQPETALTRSKAPAYRGMSGASPSNLEPAITEKQVQTGIGPDGKPITSTVKILSDWGNPAESVGGDRLYRDAQAQATKNLGDYLESPVDTKVIPWGVKGLLSSPAVWSLFHGDVGLASKQAGGALAGAGALNLAARGFTNPTVVDWLTQAVPAGQRATVGVGTAAMRALRQSGAD